MKIRVHCANNPCPHGDEPVYIEGPTALLITQPRQVECWGCFKDRLEKERKLMRKRQEMFIRTLKKDLTRGVEQSGTK